MYVLEKIHLMSDTIKNNFLQYIGLFVKIVFKYTYIMHIYND